MEEKFLSALNQVDEKVNSCTLSKSKYDELVQELKKVKSQGKKSSRDYWILERYDHSVCQFMMESNDSQFTIPELLDKMEGYKTSATTLKHKLLHRFGNEVMMFERESKPTIVCFRNRTYKVLEESWYQKRIDSEADERMRIVRAAAETILEDIKFQPYETGTYLPPGELLDNIETDIPATLGTFLDIVLKQGKKAEEEKIHRKRTSIAHAIISCVRPRTFLSSIQLATGVYFMRKFGSRMLIDVLNRMGFCTSYTSLSLYEASVIMSYDKKIKQGTFLQYVFDNADHNADTLDGLHVFHSMGGIRSVTPKEGLSRQGPIPKLSRTPRPHELASKIEIPIVYCARTSESKEGLKSILFLDVSQLRLGERPKLPVVYGLYLLAKCSNMEQIPNFGGFMESINRHSKNYSVSQVCVLPFVNMPPSNPDTINTVIHYAHLDAVKEGLKTCFVTADQPIYIKARNIVASNAQFSNVVTILGGFHMAMSFIFSIGKLMDGSGLKDVLSLIYAGNTVEHMLLGKAFSRAVRGHLLVHAALGAILVECCDDLYDDISYVRSILQDFKIQPPTMGELNDDDKINHIAEKLLKKMDSVERNGRTATLWLQYFNCVTILMQFIEAQRVGNWELHLQCVRDMLPIFHATGNFNYAKSAHIYLQDMAQLQLVMDPNEYDKFTRQGFFTIRRTDKNWCGVWTDMAVEQTLMRSMKVSGGLTSGRGVNKEGVLARWTAGMPVAYEVMEAFETFCDVRAGTSEQHVDLQDSRMKRDAADYMKLVKWFQQHDPFPSTEGDKLLSIGDGMCATKDVNCDKVLEIGRTALQLMVGQNARDVKLSRTKCVKSIACFKRGIRIEDDIVPVNTTLLFQRIVAATKDEIQLANTAFTYELAPCPLSLFDEEGDMRKSKKSDLFHIFNGDAADSIDLSECKIIIDGGFLLHKVVWPIGCTYAHILKLYEDYIYNHFGVNVIVIFDGYKEGAMGIKSYERLRRTRKTKGVEILLEKDMHISVNQANFLSIDKNKDRLIAFLMAQLTSAGMSVQQADEDADRLIAVTAVEQLHTNEKVAVIGQDVDRLVLLTALTPNDREVYFVKEGAGKIPTKVYSTKKHIQFQNIVLFSHAFTGCDTTSSFYNKGKKSIFKVLEKKKHLKAEVAVFNDSQSTRDNIKRAGEHLALALYGASEKQLSLNELRFDRFKSSAARMTTAIKLAQLPPTTAALEEHIWRVYFQIQKWQGNDKLNPTDWGWRLKDGGFFPVRNKQPPAPDAILKMIFCSCRGSCAKRCGCRKAGLKCSSICLGCNGQSCLNCTELDVSDDSPESSDDVELALVNSFDEAFSQHMMDRGFNAEDNEDLDDTEEDSTTIFVEDFDKSQATASKRVRKK